VMRTIAFFSYARHDDVAVGGLLSKIRKKLETEIQIHAGDDELEVFQDSDDLKPGDEWERKLREAIDSSAFFIPVITPFYYKRPVCRRELEIWLANYKAEDERRRIIPVRFVGLPPTKVGKNGKPEDALRAQIDAVQWIDFSKFRDKRDLRGNVSRKITEQAKMIVERMRPP
jgi:cobaltochelatase CobT